MSPWFCRCVPASLILFAAPALAQQDEALILANRHADPASALSTANVNQLQQAWTVQTQDPVSHVPLSADGRVYFADWGGSVYAVDAATGQTLWQNTIEQPRTQWPWHGFAGTGAVADGVLYEASVEGNAFAIDAASGEVVWQTALVEPPHNGVAVWSSFALDPEAGLLYFTTGNNYTGEATPLSDSLVAVDARTGEIRWHRQTVANDVWTMADQRGPDYDFAGGPQLFEAVIDGETRRLVGAGQKSGFFHVFDRITGEPVWSVSIGYGGVDGGMHGEASIGAERIIAWSNNHYIHTMPPDATNVSVKALDPATGRYLWVNDAAQPAELFAAGFLAGDAYFLGSLDGTVRAYAADIGELVWQAPVPGPVTISIVVDDGMLLVPTGAPKVFGDWAKDGKNGVTAFVLPR